MNEARILIVEDESNIRRFVRLALATESYEVFEATSLPVQISLIRLA